MTTLEVTATQDTNIWGRVTEVRKRTWVSLWIQLPDKEIVVSLEILPVLSKLWPIKGDPNSTSVEVDKRKTVSGASWLQEDFQRLKLILPNNMHSQNCGQPLFTVSSCQELLFTYQKIICFFIFISERYAQSRLGQ